MGGVRSVQFCFGFLEFVLTLQCPATRCSGAWCRLQWLRRRRMMIFAAEVDINLQYNAMETRHDSVK